MDSGDLHLTEPTRSRLAGLSVLVTGGAGFIGSHLVDGLLAQGCRVRVLDNLSTGAIRNLEPVLSQIELMDGDIRDAHRVCQAAQGMDAILHHAALTSVAESMHDPEGTYAVNLTGLLHVLEAARFNGVKQIQFASSAAVYGDGAPIPIGETLLSQPISPYGISKWQGELYCQLYAELYGIRAVCFRYFNVYGPRQLKNSAYSGVIACFANAIQAGESPIIYGDGGQIRDFIYVKDIVRANLLALETFQGSFGVFNVATGKGCSILDLCNTLLSVSGSNLPLTYRSERRGDIRHSLADIAKVQKTFGFTPTVSLEVGLHAYFDFLTEKTIESSKYMMFGPPAELYAQYVD
jgi:UDP-glucose 4-epimerase